MTWGMVAIGGGAVLGSVIGSGAAKVAAETQAQAAQAAAELQAQTAQQSIAAQQAAAAQQRADLQPFAQFGAGFINPAQQAAMQQQQLFGPGAGNAVMTNPMFQALLNQSNTNIMQNAAVSGRLGTGGTQQHLQDSALRTGFDILQQERNAAMANTGQLASLVGMGQSAAAGQGAAGINTAANIGNTLTGSAAMQSDYLTSGAAAQAAGQIGAANAWQQGIGNAIGSYAMFGGFGGANQAGVQNGLGGTINSPMSFGGGVG